MEAEKEIAGDAALPVATWAEAPTLVAPVLTLNEPYNPLPNRVLQSAPPSTTSPVQEYPTGAYAPAIEKARDTKPGRRSLPRFLPLAALLLLMLILAVVLLKTMGSARGVEGQSVNGATGAPTPLQRMALVPDVRGKSLDDARRIAGAAGVNLVEAASAYDATYSAGKVGSQQPAPGQQVQAGSSITVSVSLGPLPVVDQPAPNPQPPAGNPPPPNPPPKKGKGEDDNNGKGKHK
jgi:hypothetical protein